MKANRTLKHKRMNDRAEVGVGTLIVFIAMVLVAAVAAAVLINTSGTLQSRAEATGKQATQQVSSNLLVMGIYGTRSSATADISTLKFNVELAAGAPPVDLNKLVIRYSDGTSSNVKVFSLYHATDNPGTGANPAYNVTYIRDVSSGGSDATNKIMSAGTLVEFSFGVPSNLAERSSVQVLFIPETGAAVPADFTTPSTYGSDTVITLR